MVGNEIGLSFHLMFPLLKMRKIIFTSVCIGNISVVSKFTNIFPCKWLYFWHSTMDKSSFLRVHHKLPPYPVISVLTYLVWCLTA